MDHFLMERLRRRRQELHQIVKEKRASVKTVPPGSMKFVRRKGRTEYYWRKPEAGKYVYLNKNKRYIAEALAQKCYDEKVLKAAKAELKLVTKLIRMYELDAIDAAYSQSPQERRCLIKPVRPSDEEFRQKWLEQESCMKGFAEGDPEYFTDKGERVRSKSEIFIANTMCHLGVDYLFEHEIYLEGFGAVHPDFCVLDLKNRRTVIWEHLGKMNDPDYVERNLRRINAYLKNGYIIGETLILTFESATQPLNTREVERLVRHYFL